MGNIQSKWPLLQKYITCGAFYILPVLAEQCLNEGYENIDWLEIAKKYLKHFFFVAPFCHFWHTKITPFVTRVYVKPLLAMIDLESNRLAGAIISWALETYFIMPTCLFIVYALYFLLRDNQALP